MKRNLLSIIILALLVVNIVLSAIMMVSVASASRKTASLVADISSIIDLEINGLPKSDISTAVSQADTAFYNISEELTIPLKTGEDGKAHYAVGNVSFSMNTKHEDYATYGETMVDREALLKDIVFTVLAEYTIDEARVSSTQIKAEILSRVQERFSDFIYEVSYNFLFN